jgi:hypothetical protein
MNIVRKNKDHPKIVKMLKLWSTYRNHWPEYLESGIESGTMKTNTDRTHEAFMSFVNNGTHWDFANTYGLSTERARMLSAQFELFLRREKENFDKWLAARTSVDS